jgi:hypothetical protein
MKNTGKTDSEAITTETKETAIGSETEEKPTMPFKKTDPGKYGYVNPQPSYGNDIEPFSTNPRVMKKYSPKSPPQYRFPSRGSKRKNRPVRNIDRRAKPTDFRIAV